MNYIYFGLLCEGPTDRSALPPLIDKALGHLRADDNVRAHFEWDIDKLVGKSSSDEIRAAAQCGCYDVILAHRDGAQKPGLTRQQIKSIAGSPVPVVPVRETEAWLIADVEAFKTATRTARSKKLPRVPAASAVEKLADPKALVSALLEACLARKLVGREGEIEQWYSLIAAHVRLERLVRLRWFSQFVADLHAALVNLGWPFRN